MIHTPIFYKQIKNIYSTSKCYAVYSKIHACSCVDHIPFMYVCLKRDTLKSIGLSRWLLKLSWWWNPIYLPIILNKIRLNLQYTTDFVSLLHCIAFWSYELWSLRDNSMISHHISWYLHGSSWLPHKHGIVMTCTKRLFLSHHRLRVGRLLPLCKVRFGIHQGSTWCGKIVWLDGIYTVGTNDIYGDLWWYLWSWHFFIHGVSLNQT